jgi:hypothetical protein
MRKYLLFILGVAGFCFAGCKKNVEVIPNNGAPPAADSYMPVTAGTSWTYFIQTDNSLDTVTVKMNSSNVNLNGKTYYTANSLTKKGIANGIYFYEKNHVYATRNYNSYADAVLELQLYNDTASVNNSWVSLATDDGTVNNIPLRAISTIEEKGETKVYQGKTFTNVVHVEVDIQYDFGAGYETTQIYDYYLAKGIGILGYNLRALGAFVEAEGIIDYTIK